MTDSPSAAKPCAFEFPTVKEFLTALFEHRRRKNPRYSRAAFSRSIGVSPTMLTYLLRGDRNISTESLRLIAARLDIPAREEEYLCLLAERELARTKESVTLLEERLAKFARRGKPIEVPLDLFSPDARWYAMAIVELSALVPIDSEVESEIASALGIDPEDVRKAVEHLKTAGVLRCDENGSLCRARGEISLASTGKKGDVDRMHSQILERAGALAPVLHTEERIYASGFYAIRKERITKFRKKFYALLDEFHDESLREHEPDSVYGISVAGFKIFDSKGRFSR